MVKQILLLLPLLTGLLAKSQNQQSFAKTLTIGFQYGDEAMTYEEIKFKKDGNKVIGTISRPNTNKLLLSDVELNVAQIKTIDSFLNLVEKYKVTPCEERSVSSYVQYYTIIKDKDSTTIYRFCDWQNLTFFKIKHLLFDKYLESLELKRVSTTAEYFKIFKGKWKESTPLDKLSLTAVCELTKANQEDSLDDYIEFISPTKLLIHRKNRNERHNYRLEFIGGNTYIELDAYENGSEFIYGHSFLLIKSDKNQLKLSRGFP
jgi:hypothetical protein